MTHALRLNLLALAVLAGATAHAGLVEVDVPERALCTICTGSTPHPPETPAVWSMMDDTPVYFCNELCLKEFETDPEAFYSRALHSVMAKDAEGTVQAVCSGQGSPVLVARHGDPLLESADLESRLGLDQGSGLRVMVLVDPMVPTVSPKPGEGAAWSVAEGVMTLLGLSETLPLALLDGECHVVRRMSLSELDSKE